ncbi:MAG: type II secretion system secretin GspD [Bdellovibrionaceae bacterium]|nr:type II secretion system secretin GspD [Pseudobdellovibrionaceae bacterium]
MKKSKKIVIASLVTGLAGAPAGPVAHAQEDMPPPPDFDSSFPAPPSFPAPTTAPTGPSAQVAAEDAGVLNKNQRQKFNASGIEDINNQNFPETIESFDFPNVEITDIIKTISELTGKNFIIDPGVRGKITIVAPSKITVAEAYKAFLSALAINGYTVVPSGAFLKVKNARNAQRDSIETYSGAYYPSDDQMITRIIHLKHISAEIVQRELRILPSKDGELSIYSPTNSIILSDYGSNIDRVMKIINQLDVPGFEEQIEVVRVKQAKAKDMADLIDKIVNKGQKSGGGAGVTGGMPGSFSAGVPRFTRSTGGGAQGQSGNSFFMAIPDDRTNSIIVVGNKSGIARVKRLVAQLDFPVRPDAIGGVYVYYVKYGDAEKIAQVLQNVTKDAAPKTGAGANAPGAFPGFGGFGAPVGTAASENQIFGGEVKINADKNTNSLVVSASKTDYDRVLNLLSKIDIPRDQVFVEANIMEMSMTEGMDYKVGYYQYDKSGIKGGFNGGLNLTELLSPVGGTGAILPFGNGENISLTDPTSNKTITVKSLTGFFTFLKSTTRLNVLSNPTITALNNEEAVIEVGDRVATSVQANVTAAGTTNTAVFEDATLKLQIKPFINPTSNSIRMEVQQSINQPTKNIVAPKALSDNTIAISKRSIKTNIVVDSGNTAILGGLLRDSDNESISKVPLLGDLPIIGWLFKSRSSNREKVNLVVFLTPKVLRSPADNNQVIGRKIDERLEFIKAGGGKDPFGRKVEEIMRGDRAAVSPEFSAPEAPAPFEPRDVPPAPAEEPGSPQIFDDGASSDSGPDELLEEEMSSADMESSPAPGGDSQQFQPGTDEGVDEPLVE